MKKYIVILLLLLNCNYIYSQLNNLKFERISIKEGLSQATVNCLIQDSKGFIWIGTFDGLNKYDGYNFVNYKNNPKNKQSISSNAIFCLMEDNQHKIWIGTRGGGLNCYDPERNTFASWKNIPNNDNSLINDYVRAIFQDSKGIIWVGTMGGLSKLQVVNNDSVYFVNYKSENRELSDFKSVGALSNNVVYAITEDSDGNLFIGTEKGINHYIRSENKFRIYTNNNTNNKTISYNAIRAFYTDKNKNLLVGTSNGLNKLIGENAFERFFFDSVNRSPKPSSFIWSIKKDRNDNFWYGTMGGLIVQNKGAKISESKLYTSDENNPDKLSNNFIWNILEDKAGIIWLGTSQGICKFNAHKYKFEHIKNDPTNVNSLSSNKVSCFLKDRKGRLWVGTSEGGLNLQNTDKNQFVRLLHDDANPKTIPSNYIRAIFEDSNGEIWVGTNGGLCKIIEKGENTFEFKQYLFDEKHPIPNQVASKVILSIHQDRNNRIWIGTIGGVSVYNPVSDDFISWRNNPKDSTTLPHNYIYDIYTDNNNRTWFATNKGLAYALNNDLQNLKFGKFLSVESDTTTLTNNYITCIYQTQKGTLWFGTASGLNKLNSDGKSFTQYRLHHGLPNEVIFGILEHKQYLWLVTNKGISKFNPETESFKNYFETDGLQGNAFIDGAYYQSSNGEFFVGGYNGFNRFFPEGIIDDPYLPEIVITNFQILNRDVSVNQLFNGRQILNKTITYTDIIELSYKDYVFSFEFAALHFASSAKVKYAYKMDGFDEEWNYTDENRRFATYTNLDAGTYTFRVKGTNGDGIWSNKEAVIKVIISPPFWKTLWFQIISLVIIFGSVGYFLRSRYNNIKRQKAELEKQVILRTTEIVHKNEILENQKAELNKSYDDLKELSEIGSKITSNLSVESIIETIYENINRLLDAEILGIGIYIQENNALHFPYTIESGKKMEPYEHSLESNNRLSVKCFVSGKPILVNDFENDFKDYLSSEQKPIEGRAPMSIIYEPLLSKGNIIGVLTVQSKRKNAYQKHYTTYIKTIATNTSIALDNAHAYNEIRLKTDELTTKNEALSFQKKEIEDKGHEIEMQRNELLEKNENITASIKAAQDIQSAILPEAAYLSKFLQYFIIYRPKDIVSGDFYWFANIPEINEYMVAVIDCTGHGVSGAFMSMITNTLLNEIVYARKIYDPALILDNLDSLIRTALKQNSGNNKDGLDISLIRIQNNVENCKIVYAGAKNCLLYVDNKGNMTKLAGTRRSLGGIKYNHKKPLENTQLMLLKNSMVYLYTDGIVDQNAPDRKRFGTIRLMEFLVTIYQDSLPNQKLKLENELDNYQSVAAQRDDITFLAIRV